MGDYDSPMSELCIVNYSPHDEKIAKLGEV